MRTDDYVRAIYLTLAENSCVASYVVMRERVASQQGLFHAQIVLTNGDFLDTSEFFVSGPNGIETMKYRHQWMDSTHTQLRRRWDNKRHFPRLHNFPHHCHDGSETNVVTGESLSIIAVLQRIQAEIESVESPEP